MAAVVPGDGGPTVDPHINGKARQVLTSMVDPMRFPGADIVALYGHRWEIELGFFGK